MHPNEQLLHDFYAAFERLDAAFHERLRQGFRQIAADHPDVAVYTAAVDRELNAQGYILPGLGDAGDRLFGTR